jgi:hypothetical protein
LLQALKRKRRGELFAPAFLFSVITGFVPVNHVLLSFATTKTSMAGSSPAMTGG